MWIRCLVFFTTETFAYLIGNVSFFPTTFRECVHAQVILPLRIGDNVPRHSIRYRILMTAIYFSESCSRPISKKREIVISASRNLNRCNYLSKK